MLLDNFYVDGEVSADGHNWSLGAYATDYLEKPGLPIMVEGVAITMQKEQKKRPTTRADSFGTWRNAMV